ncbi:MAG: outer membrane beta-barrel protein, partial [Phaeodactylibacter sp.]|nr:outer membrane beta-barrel protein [Phaeodactylibacter sp.]
MKKDQNMDQRFKDALSTPPSFDYDPEAWAAVEERLKQARRKPAGVFLPGWAAGLAVLLLFGLCGFTSYLSIRLNRAERQLARAEARFNQRADTVWLVKDHYIYDTVNIHGWQQPAMQSAGNWTRRFPIFQPGAFSSSGVAALSAGKRRLDDSTKAGLPGRLPILQRFGEEENTTFHPELSRTAPVARLPRADAPTPGSLNPSPPPFPAIAGQKSSAASWLRRTAHQTLKRSKPQGLALMASGSIANVFSMPGTSFSSYILGIGGELGYGPHWKVEAGLELLHLSFELYQEDNIHEYPSLMPDNPSDGLQELYVRLEYLQLPFAVKYFFAGQGSMRPYLKAGAVLRQARRQDFNFEFAGPSGPYYRPLSIREDSFYLSSLRGGPGLALGITRNWGLFAEALLNYDHRLGKNDHTLMRYLSFNAGLQFR